MFFSEEPHAFDWLNRLKSLLTVLFFLIVGVLYFNPMLSSRVIFCERDLAPFFIPPKFLWVSQLKNFEFPFWNPHNYSGIPLLATLQPGVFYPPHIFYLLLPFNVVWNWLIILHFVFAGLATYAFLRYIRVTNLSAAAGGMVFMLSGYLLSVHNLLPHLFGVSWFPLILLYFIKYFETNRKRHIVLSSIFLVVQFLAGAPEIVILTVIVLFITVFFLKAFTSNDVSIRDRLFGLLWIGTIFIFLSGIQWTSFYELHRQSIRSSGLNYISATTWSFAWRDFIQFFLPDVFGYQQTLEKYWLNQSWLKTVYLGLGPLLFSTFFFVRGGRKRFFFGGLIVFSLILGLGGNTPVYKLLHMIPPFNAVRYPVKFLFLLFFAISVTTAMGLDVFREGLRSNDKVVKRLVLVFFYTGFVFALGWGFLYFRHEEIVNFLNQKRMNPPLYNEIWFNVHNAKRFLLFSFLLCTGLLLYARLRLRKILLCSVVLVLVMDLFLANYGFYGSVSWKWFTTLDGFARGISNNAQTERFMVSVKTENDLNSLLIGKNILVSPYAAMHGLYSTGGAEVMRIGYHEKYLGLFRCVEGLEEARSLLDIGGIKHVILSYPVDNSEFKLDGQEKVNDKDAYLYTYRGYPGRFLFFNRVHFVDDDQKVMLKMIDQKSDFRKELIITLPGARESLLAKKPIRGTGHLVSYHSNRIVLTSETDGDGFLYLSDTYYPGWRAYVDGKETKIYRANLAFRAIEVPAGRHTVVFRYVPLSFYLGLCLTLFGVLLCIWLLLRDRRISSPAPNGQDHSAIDDKGNDA